METIKKRLGRNVALLRKQHGLTQARLAEAVKISPTFMMHIERGTRGASLETVETLAMALGVDVSLLFMESTPRFADERHKLALDFLERELTGKMTHAIKMSLETVLTFFP
ncbi:MAG: helix-turn-helix transcriptional regulator [Spirochaetales bacterium]|nr:helix-turn-helix transcriptional regulator [Spirochaetales bacterium]